MTTKVVISKYNEDVNWVKDIKYETLIYDKSDNPIEGSIPRPNIGREAETLLYYIIEHYNNLPDITIFLQGDPRSNPISYTYEEVVETINKGYNTDKAETILTWQGRSIINDYFLHSVPILINKLFENISTIVNYSSGVQYVLPRCIILNRPLDFYILLHSQIIQSKDQITNDSLNAWVLEPVWGVIFDTTKILKSNYRELIS